MGISAIYSQTIDAKLFRTDTQLPAAEQQTENAVKSEDDGVIVDIVDIQNTGNTQVEDTQDISKTEFNYIDFYFDPMFNTSNLSNFFQNAKNAQVEDTQDIGKTKFNYKAFNYNPMFNASNLSNIIDAIDNNAATYAYVKMQLQENYSGDELTQQLNSFDQYFSDILHNPATSGR